MNSKIPKERGGNYNCIYCPKYKLEGRHRCELYKKNLGLGRGPGLWVLPCTECHQNKTYGGCTTTVFGNGATQCRYPIAPLDTLPPAKSKLGYSRKELLKICRERKIPMKMFWKSLGCGTRAIENGEERYYTCDVEMALYKLNANGGKWHMWD